MDGIAAVATAEAAIFPAGAVGAVVTRDVPDGALAISRVRQENKEGYASKLKGRLAASAKK